MTTEPIKKRTVATLQQSLIFGVLQIYFAIAALTCSLGTISSSKM